MTVPVVTPAKVMRLHRNRRRWFVLGAVLLVLAAALYFFDWNMARPYLAHRISAATGRSFAINGDLDVQLSLRPRIIVNDLVLGNASWSQTPVMARIQRADFRIDLLSLMRGQWLFPHIYLRAPTLLLEASSSGQVNWDFGQTTQSAVFPRIDALAIDGGRLDYRDPAIATALSFLIVTQVSADDHAQDALVVTGQGAFKGLAGTLSGRGDALLALRSESRPYAFSANARLGSTSASVDGVLLDPLHFKAQDLNFSLKGSDLASLYPIVGVPLPPTPAYSLTGALSHAGALWTFKRLKGVVGNSDLAGTFALDRGRSPQFITATLHSQKLDLNDLGGFIGADRGDRPSAHPAPGDKLLPTEAFSLEKLNAADADVHFTGRHIITRSLPLDHLSAHLRVDAGSLQLTPVQVELAGGKVHGHISLNGASSPLRVTADITASGLLLEQLLPSVKLTLASTGILGGRTKLQATGNSIAQMLASANGEAALIMDGGQVSELLLRLSNLDITRSLALLIGGDKQVPIRCVIANFNAVDGEFRVQQLLLDTPKVRIGGAGMISFVDETLDLTLKAHAADFSLAALRGPILLTGTFKTPKMKPDMKKVLTRGGLALALGLAASPLTALLPLLELGKDHDSHCQRLLIEAKKDTGIKQSDIRPRK